MNRVIIVTGASSGIGKAAAKMFLDGGDVVYNLCRNPKGNSGAVEIKCDVTLEKDCANAINQILTENGKIDILVNNAGFGISGPIETTTLDSAKRLFDANFFGSLNMIKQVLPSMRKNKAGKIINVSSVASVVPIPFQAFYASSKAAIDSLSFALRGETKNFGIYVCSVMPGDTKTGFTAHREKQQASQCDDYASIMQRSISQMEKDEQSGMSAEEVAKVIYKVANKNKPPLRVTAGKKYKILVFLAKILPYKWLSTIVFKIYA